MMELLRKSLDSFFAGSLENAIYSVTSDDTLGICDGECQEILQALLGSSKTKTPVETVDLLKARWQERWSWRVLLKALLFLHYVLESSTTTIPWLQCFFADLAILKRCADFGSADTPQDASHSHILRAYSQFLTMYYSCVTDVHSPHAKTRRIQDLPQQLPCEKKHLLLCHLEKSLSLLQQGTGMFVAASAFRAPHGFTQLTADVARTLLRTCLRLYSIVSLEVVALLDRLENLDLGELKGFETACASFLSLSTDMVVFCDSVRTFPSSSQTHIPRLCVPDESTLLVIQERLRWLEREQHCQSSSPVIGNGKSCAVRGREGEDCRLLDEPDFEGHGSHSSAFSQDLLEPQKARSSRKVMGLQSSGALPQQESSQGHSDLAGSVQVIRDSIKATGRGKSQSHSVSSVSQFSSPASRKAVAELSLTEKSLETQTVPKTGCHAMASSSKDCDVSLGTGGQGARKDGLSFEIGKACSGPKKLDLEISNSHRGRPASSLEGLHAGSASALESNDFAPSSVRVVDETDPPGLQGVTSSQNSLQLFRQASLLGYKIASFQETDGKVEM